MDNFGPLYVRDIYPSSDNRMHKAWITLYTCASTRLILLDLVAKPESLCFVNSLRRFIARCRCPEHIISDNGTNFISEFIQCVKFEDEVAF